MRRMGVGAIEEPPAVAVESANVRTDFAAKMKALMPNLRERAEAILDLLRPSLNKGTRRQIQIGVERLAAQVTESATFALDQFQEAAERVTTSAKAEIDAVVTHVVQATGIPGAAGDACAWRGADVAGARGDRQVSGAYITKGTRIRARWLQSTNASLAGCQPKVGAVAREVTGVVRHVYGTKPDGGGVRTNSSNIDPDAWDGPTVSDCSCGGPHVAVKAAWVVGAEEKP